MANFKARMIHPSGPYPFPIDPNADRDTSHDPRSVFTLADTIDLAKATFTHDNPEFIFHTGPEEVL